METSVEKKKMGNPNFGKKKKEGVDSLKTYRFQLIKTHEKVKPRDRDTGEMLENPYPPIYIAANSGVAYDAETDQVRRWRYLYGYPSIWEDEQTNPEPSPQQLAHERNDIIFRQGFLTVRGNDKAKIQALKVQDAFEGNENPLEDKPRIYRLLDENLELNKIRSSADAAYEAETEARNSSLEDMLPIASVFGIDVTNPEENADKIRTAFILRAKSDPQAFLKQVVNPRNTIVFKFRQAFQKNILSVVEGKVIMVDTQRVLFEVNPDKDAAEQAASSVLAREDKAEKAYEQIGRLLA